MPRPNGGGKKFNNPKFLSDELFELAGGASKEMMSDVKPPQRALDLQVEDDFVLLPEGDDENSSPNKPLSKVTQMPAFAARKRKQEKDGINEVKDWQNNFLERMEKQVAARSKSKECLLRSLSTVSEMLEANQVTLKESEQSLQLLMGNILKRNKHMLAAHNQCVNAIKEIQHNYQKECELQESRQREASRADAEEMADKVNALMEKLIKESRRSQMEKLRKSMKYAMEFDM